MLHCRSTSHLRRTRFPLLPLLQLRVRELDPWRKTSTPRPLPRVPCHRRLPCPQPSSNSDRDAVTPRPTKASDGQLPSMRITPGRQAAAVLRCTGSGLPSAGCQRSVTTRFPGQEPSIESTSTVPRERNVTRVKMTSCSRPTALRMGIVLRTPKTGLSWVRSWYQGHRWDTLRAVTVGGGWRQRALCDQDQGPSVQTRR